MRLMLTVPAATIALALTLAFAPGVARAELVEAETGVKYADTIDAGGKKLAAMGAGVREKFWVNVYAAALYIDAAGAKTALAKYKGKSASELSDNASFFKDLVKADVTKALLIHVVRNVGVQKMKDALNEGLALNMKVEGDATRFVNQLSKDLVDGDKILFVWTPGGKSQMVINGKAGPVYDNKKLADSLQKIWYGDSPASEDIKAKAADRAPSLLK